MVHSLLIFSQIHGMLVKISVLPSVNVIHLRIDHKLITIFIINRRWGRVYWGGCGKGSKFENSLLYWRY